MKPAIQFFKSAALTAHGAHVAQFAGIGALAVAFALPFAASAQPQAGMSAGASAVSAPKPAAIAAPADCFAAITWGAAGTQNPECKADSKGAFAWMFTAPEADLMGADKARAGTHGAGPFWLAQDGSKVNGSVKARADAPRQCRLIRGHPLAVAGHPVHRRPRQAGTGHPHPAHQHGGRHSPCGWLRQRWQRCQAGQGGLHSGLRVLREALTSLAA